MFTPHDPQDILGGIYINPNGRSAAHKDRPDNRLYDWAEIGFGMAPIDWSKGYDVEACLSKIIGSPLQLPAKNQGASGSCGGQADGTYGSVLAAAATKKFVEMSAKFTYAQAYAPGGGCYPADLSKLALKVGFAPEATCPSYDAGQAPGELFMEHSDDITDAARHKAKSDRTYSSADVPLNIDSIAQAIAVTKGVRLAILGSNNGTWLTADPLPPQINQPVWAHFMYFGKVAIRNGVKAIGGLNSWGPGVGDRGWQWITQDYIDKMLPATPWGRAVWNATTYVFNPNQIPNSFAYKFEKPLSMGDSGDDVRALQTLLQIDGQFPASVPVSGYYGNITRQAVLAFQEHYQVAAEIDLVALGGKQVGPATLKELNALAS